jgi:hypothetical protein
MKTKFTYKEMCFVVAKYYRVILLSIGLICITYFYSFAITYDNPESGRALNKSELRKDLVRRIILATKVRRYHLTAGPVLNPLPKSWAPTLLKYTPPPIRVILSVP